MGTTSIADALFTKAQQRVLGVLFGNPGRSFYLQEIVARAESGTGAVQRELARLESAGLVTVRRLGKQKHFQANAEAPVYEELRGLVLKTSGLADVLRDALAPLAAEIDVAFVFGSVAKREDTTRSDVDLFVGSERVSHADLFEQLTHAEEVLGRRVNPIVYTPGELRERVQERNGFVTTVLSQPKIWLLGSERALAA
jgi:predicted nucleotidyltransferase